MDTNAPWVPPIRGNEVSLRAADLGFDPRARRMQIDGQSLVRAASRHRNMIAVWYDDPNAPGDHRVLVYGHIAGVIDTLRMAGFVIALKKVPSGWKRASRAEHSIPSPNPLEDTPDD